uniref:Uncharacterized protein n=1 Tax=Acrobeloides nanus TaxID=290746 RepID=A0A914CPD9_9BILA
MQKKISLMSILFLTLVLHCLANDEKIFVNAKDEVVKDVLSAPVGQCPGGPSLPVECDPKRPWPQCPPQSYCYATNSDVGPYFCCPIWST